jgi:cytochrome c oxidase assembly factor CtaG
MVRGKVKLIAKKCKHCSVTNEVSTARIKGGLCYTCRKSMHDAVGMNMLKQAPVRLKVLLSVISLCCLLLAGYAIYYSHIVLPYGGGRVRSRVLEFNGFGVAVPALALIMFAIGLLAVVAANFDRYSNEKAYERVIRRSLCLGLFLYWVSIFFADKYRL